VNPLGARDEAIRTRVDAAGIPTAFVHSPNYNDRPARVSIDTLVIHFTALDMDKSITHLTSQEKAVSTHYVIDRDGGLVQLVPVEKRSWHAGVSALGDRRDVNSFSVGIDLVYVPDNDNGFTSRQYAVLAALSQALMAEFPIKGENILGHEHVALPVGRKCDPGPEFDWERYFGDLELEGIARPGAVRG